MRLKLTAGLLAAGLAIAPAVMSPAFLAQEGHPLVGSWHGNWGDQAKRTDLTVVMDWDGTKLTGIVNPGFDQAQMENAKLTPKGWVVHFEVTIKDAAGRPLRCVADGNIDKLGSDRRTLAGTWVCGTTRGDFKLTRDRDY